MQRKILPIVLLALFMLTACSYLNKYGPYKVLVKVVTKAFQTADKKLQEAKTAKDVANILNTLAVALDKAAPTMNKLTRQYPELKNAAKYPEVIADDIKEWKQTARSFDRTLRQTIGRFRGNADVQTALRAFQAAARKVD